MSSQKEQDPKSFAGAGAGKIPPEFERSMKSVYHYLMKHVLNLLLITILYMTIMQATQMGYDDVLEIYALLQNNLISVVVLVSVMGFGLCLYVLTRPKSVYLIEFSCFKPDDKLKVGFDMFLKHSGLSGYFDGSSMEFQKKIIERSGLGQETYLPLALHALPPKPTLADARFEAEQGIYDTMDNLFASTLVKPKDIGILVVNNSLYNPTPSLSAMIVNKYKLRSNILSFNIGGMGCSASLIAVDLAKDMLRVHPNTYAIVISNESITQNWYRGNKKSMLIPNCLFRIGSAAILLSNKPEDRRRAKYKLAHAVRTHCGADNRAFNCVYQGEDNKGNSGISLSKDLMGIAGKSLKMNITTLGPLVLPISEQILFFANVVARKLFKNRFEHDYVPDFKLAFDHLCIHAGGRGVIDELEKNLRLSPDDVEASRMTLYRFGNTSSSSIWYELAYLEAKEKMKKGNKVWQIAFGSGFKCNSAVLEALRNINPSHNNPWADSISKYPIKIGLIN